MWLSFEQDGDSGLLWIAACIPMVLVGILSYGFVMQSRIPVVQTTSEEITVNNAFTNSRTVQWQLVTNLKKYPIFGYKLESIGRSLWLPIGMLDRRDAENLLSEVKKHIDQEA